MRKAFHDRRGFTLTELAIVLGVAGIILGGIWAATAKVMDNSRLQATVKNNAVILQQYRSLFPSRGVDSAPGVWADITCNGVTNGYFPKDMVKPNTVCATGNGSTYPQHPWNNYIQVFSYYDYQDIFILYSGLTQAICARLMQQLGTQPDVNYEVINGTARTMSPYGNQTPFNTTEIDATCVAGNGNYIIVGYKAR